MLIPIALGAAALYGLYKYSQSKSSAHVEGALAAAPAAPPAGQGYAGSSGPANNPSGQITYAQPITVPGFNIQMHYVAPPQATSPQKYPDATTVNNPNDPKYQGYVNRYQTAAPIPSGVYYYPAAGDVWAVVAARLGGSSKSYLAGNPNKEPAKMLPLDQVGKLNGFVTLTDASNWIKAGKPIQLPQGSWNDVAGPVVSAMGSVR